ncbi:hypothetical protein H6G33_36515 [Calothrix sp. FACHB-1219]|uniref:IS1/IS1595 family N-terminal zinc-binding domain-containing protein n=1 Tax=unclassified Calothrix TaxID=2619626 RepID=UPI001683BD85|nr:MULTISPECIES: IS1 family transposase [unclassified Calothrix]MBD2207827.1 hypothetical protein [Calothrix sp. FACHB-168]MBD2222437.1 hypothetical protein [Calothrix sp. FACHB-1219]
MQGSLNSLNQFKNQLFIFSFGLGLASTVAVFQPNSAVKEFGKSLLGFSIAGVVIGELVTSRAFIYYNKDAKSFDEIIKLKARENNEISRNLDKAINDLATSKQESQRLENDLQQALKLLKSRSDELVTSRENIYQLETKLKEVGRFSTREAHKIVRESYNRSLRKLEAHIEALMRNYSPIADEFNSVLIEVDKFRNRYIKKLEEYDQLTDFNDLIDVGLDMQDKIINGCIELRVKGQSIAIRYLDSLLQDSVSYRQYEQDVINLQEHAGKTIQELKAENEAQVRAIVSDWVKANNQHIENYEINYTELLEAGKQAIAKLQERDALIAQMQAELEELRKPWQFTGTIDYAQAGNAIINFYYQAYGYVLDAIAWQETETGYTLTFATGRNKVYLTADMLHDKDNSPQLAGLTNALTLPEFTPNYQSGLMVLEVQTRKPSKKKAASESDINKLWVSAAKFEATVKGWSRIRITGGSESGKSPTAENLAVCILKNRPGVVKLFNPQFDSVKNYWTIPTVGTSHNDSEKAIKELAKKVDNRANGQEFREQFELWLFDEIDSTFSHTHNKKAGIADSVCFVIKQASHQNLGAIFIGQNANVTEYKGMSRSDWNSAVNVHIGNNAYDAITNSNQFTSEEQNRLKAIADKLTEFCTSKNDELQLDNTDPNAYRFALVVEPGKKPYFMELPAFSAYTYDQITSVADVADSVASQLSPPTPNAVTLVNQGVASNVAKGIAVSCPKCSSSNVKKNGKTKTTQKYQCKDCGHNYAMPLN